MERPNCATCGRPLCRRTHTVTLRRGSSAPKEIDGRLATELKRVSVDKNRDHAMLWLGEWGYEGNGSFCSMVCGYAWAVRQLNSSNP